LWRGRDGQAYPRAERRHEIATHNMEIARALTSLHVELHGATP